ncbi:glycosyltransferase family 2 protein [Rufibacter glacialis]|uniref:Glycosyltransferase family 2 protein n=1 Tax=Rufibacter glacialis TaxID=1259555 RepID=A0A5M8Q926_9BACT|nr:glycosyltransferase family 2 protein [Rufibacter glacialis]KAA6432379.1 glycosyltransferase family 2 protein [Rufibacter glacialis]GGK78183.1 glycosyl transferase [Rufibacter glacialis]
MTKLSIVIPCYFNEQNIPATTKELISSESLFDEEVEFEYIFVDDGSGDNTLQELLKFKKLYPSKVKVLKLAGNVGSYNAVVAGMEVASGDCTVIIAADLQDPPELMVQMYNYWKQGFKLVIGNRMDREESPVQKFFSNTFHSIMKKIALKNIPDGGFDYVFFDRQIREEVVKMKERNSNIFYLMTWMGYAYINIPYVRKKREIGKSRWTLQKKIKLLIDSLLSFSFFPIRAISVIGIGLGLGAFIYGLYIMISRFMGFIDVEGWSALMVVVLFVSSFQMIAIGILGEYVWRGLDASRERPLFVVEKVY